MTWQRFPTNLDISAFDVIIQRCFQHMSGCYEVVWQIFRNCGVVVVWGIVYKKYKLGFKKMVLFNVIYRHWHTIYPKKYAHGFCFAVLCCGYTLTDFPIFIRLISLALWQSNDCPSASKATLMKMDKYFMWIHYERLHNHNKAKHNKTVCIFLGIYCTRRGITWYLIY